ncbi:uncharacterized protein LOC116653610 [Coturnix japonica]|uniref:uncharacterized protein LOC116653610 n=1 Tax=Coturnix japonica TaxID=93934 RepID=UPI0013A5EE15|nr:uncharacterized protein LOC116653610 [Coturnix japonica]
MRGGRSPSFGSSKPRRTVPAGQGSARRGSRAAAGVLLPPRGDSQRRELLRNSSWTFRREGYSAAPDGALRSQRCDERGASAEAPSGPQPPWTGRPHRGYFCSRIPLRSTAVPRREGEKETQFAFSRLKNFSHSFFFFFFFPRSLAEPRTAADGKETPQFKGAVGPRAQNAQLTLLLRFPLAWFAGAGLAQFLLSEMGVCP